MKNGLRKNRFLYIFLGRHLFPLRTATFLTAGALRIPFAEFFVADILAALISVTIMLAIGFWLGEIIPPEVWSEILQRLHIYIAIILVLCGAVYYYKSQKKG